MQGVATKLSPAVFVLTLICVFSSCGGGGPSAGGNTSPAQPTSVSISPSTTSLEVGSTQQFTATVTNVTNTTVTWSVNGIHGGNTSVGTISKTGLYTAPNLVPSAGSVTIQATSQADPAKSGTASVSLTYPAPSLKTIAPDTVTAGSATTMLSVFGADFNQASVVSLDGKAQTTDFVGSGELTISIPASSQTLAGTHQVTVTNPAPGGGTTTTATFTVANPVPQLNSLSPSSLPVGSTATRVTLSGAHFMPSSTVNSTSSALTTTYVSANQLVTTVPAQSLATSGTVSLTVTNLSPGGGTSDSASLAVGNSSQISDAPGVNQSNPMDAGYPVYLEGTAKSFATMSSTTSLSMSTVLSTTSTPVQPTWLGSCAFERTQGGACVDGVTWIRQVPPPNPPTQYAWSHTGNCGPTSLVILEYFLGLEAPVIDDPGNPNANIDPDDIQDVDSFMEENQCPLGAEGGACFDSEDLGTDPGDAGYDYADLGPIKGIPIDYLADIATWRDKLVTRLISPADPSVDCSTVTSAQQGSCVDQQLQPLLDQLKAGNPVIIHGYYEFGQVPATRICGSGGTKPCGHYMVLVGMDAPGSGANSSVYVVDPGRSASNYQYADYASGTCTLDQSGNCLAYYPYTKLELATQLTHPWWGGTNPEALVVCRTAASCDSAPRILAQSIENLPAGQVGVPYSAAISADSGQTPYTWSVDPNTLPSGLTLNSPTGVISGTPTVAGTFSFVVTVSDQNQKSGSGAGIIQINQTAGGLAITTPALLPAAIVNQLYNLQLTNAGSTISTTYSLVNSSLPAGLNLSPSGLISGTPTSSTSNATFTLQAAGSTSGGASANKQMSINVLAANLPPELYSVLPTPATVIEGGTSSLDCVASDPQGSALTYNWSFTGGTYSGTGSVVNWTAPSASGEYTATCTVSDTTGQQVSMSASISVNDTTLSAAISPTTGAAGTTQFSVTGSGATPNGSATGTVTLPDGTTAISHATADSSGAFAFNPFTEAQPGTYTEAISDDKTGAQSNVVVWTVTPSGVFTVSPSSWAPVFTAGDSAATLGFYITNQAGGSLTGTISAATNSGGQWLTVNGHASDSWVAPETEEVTANPAGLAAGAYTGTLTISSPNPPTTMRVPVTMKIYNGLQITTTALPDAVSGQPYDAQLQASGGTGTGYTWTLVSGTLPVGITFSPSGLLSGTVGSLSGSITETLKIAVQDSAGHQAINTFSLLWREGLAILPYSPSNFQFSVGTPYSTPPGSVTLTAVGGTPPYTWSATGMPPGLSIVASSGLVIGTPTQPGNFTASVTLTDSKGQSATSPVAFTVVLTPLTITTGTLPPGTVGAAYTQFVNAQGGSQSGYTWSVQGSLPPGLNGGPPPGGSSTAGLEISGTPTQAGTYTFTAIVTDSLKDTTQQSVTIVINTSSPPQITTSTLNLATVGSAYTFTFAATGGAGGYQWSFVGSGPDPSLQLSAGGVLSGTSTVPNDCPTGPGVWVGSGYPSTYFQVKVTDSSGQSAVRQLCLPAYYPTPQITSLNPPALTIDGQQHAITVNGSRFRNNAYIFDSGNLPTTYVGGQAISFVLSPTVGGAFSAGPSGPLFGDTTSQLWVVQPYSNRSNQVNFTIYDPAPTIGSATAVLNNSSQPCTANVNCQLVINGGGLVYDTTYTISETGQTLIRATYPSTPIPWNTVTTSAFSLSAGTYTLDVTNPNQASGGSATAVASFTVQ